MQTERAPQQGVGGRATQYLRAAVSVEITAGQRGDRSHSTVELSSNSPVARWQKPPTLQPEPAGQLGALRAGAATTSRIGLSLPRPTGPHAVGVRSTFLAEPSRIDTETGRPRMLPIRVFYPARDVRGARPARYLSPVIQPRAEAGFGLPEGAFDIDPHAFEGPPTQRHVRGVILASPAYQLPVAFETAQVVDLASRGWTLVTLDHPHETAIAEQPGGTWVNGDLDRASSFLARLVDVGVVLDQLSTLVPGWYPGIPVAMFGHSMGGSAAAEAMLLYPTIRAGVNLDGSPRGRVVDVGLDRPFGVMLSNHRSTFVEGVRPAPGQATVHNGLRS